VVLPGFLDAHPPDIKDVARARGTVDQFSCQKWATYSFARHNRAGEFVRIPRIGFRLIFSGPVLIDSGVLQVLGNGLSRN